MKTLVFFLIVIANISDNGKASVDSILPVNANLFLEDTTKSSDNSCHRPCKFKVKPRRCLYNFKVEPSIQDNGKTVIAINNMIPGPQINACVNDIIVVEVENRIPDQDLTVHWHGVDQHGTPYMDGVPMVTQCPIAFGSKYKYAFRASNPGTFFYHADAVSHQTDGVFGALIINQPQPLEPNSVLYDYDRSLENTLIVSADFPKLLTGNLEYGRNLRPVSLKINQYDDITKIFVIEGYSHRLRLINAIGVECPIVFSIEEHDMTIISTDGRPVKPVHTSQAILYPGERMDVVVKASKEPSGYWINMSGRESCAGLRTRGMFLYSGFNYTSMLHNENKDFKEDMDITPVSGQKTESLIDVPISSNIRTLYLGIDRNKVLHNDADNDFRYISDAIPKKPFFPASLGLHETGVVQINGKSFLYPNVPLLLRPKDVKEETTCKVGEEDNNQEPQCTQMIEAKENEVLELVLVNEGYGSEETLTFHMHGFGMEVVSTWQNHGAVSKNDVEIMDREGNIKRNTINPPIKDTVYVPNKGFTIVRIRPNQPGAWLLECRSCGAFSLPTAVLISVPISLPKSILDILPKCGSYRPPDVLLN